ncbi:hypothetical protein NXU83_14095 [Bacteroides thetaiotaomicron]|uniref:hypothetical protein n=1 Tax=Bacteroides thetaiotaomicron TaxID=818 RepID=UPI0021651333|nr:hypothetical protein [Bacteroides thetaiotaomicron]MCS3182655.1 hypothetical protein [Bacteroides thetaiotaomicron]
MTQEEAINKLSEWANGSHAYLCNREGYPRGYKDGISQAKVIVLGILSQIGEPEQKEEPELVQKVANEKKEELYG